MRPFLALLAALLLAPAAHAAGPFTLVGVAEDAVKQPDLVGAKARMTLIRLAGFDSVRITSIWAPGETRPSATEAAQLRNVAAAARLSGIRVIVSVYHFGSRTTPLTDEARAQFASYSAAVARSQPSFRDFIVGNEPNLNRFWMPQFGPNGENVAAPAYVELLARTYDALKAVSPKLIVYGGAVSPRGGDRPGTGRDTHSPTAFIRGMGAAYRASGRPRPLMDQFAFHPYCDNSSQSPRECEHPRTTTIGIADYEKLVALLGEAFDGTAQRGSTLPILYDEFGVESEIPAGKLKTYTGTEPTTTKPVPEATQAAYYRQALELAFCQPNVRGILLFHAFDEPARLAWQSGVYYADETPKASLRGVAKATAELRRGIVAKCRSLPLTPRVRRFAAPREPLDQPARIAFALECHIDCAYTARLERLPARTPVLGAKGRAAGRLPTRVAFAPRRIAPGSYRISVTLVAPVNPGRTVRIASGAFEVR